MSPKSVAIESIAGVPLPCYHTSTRILPSFTEFFFLLKKAQRCEAVFFFSFLFFLVKSDLVKKHEVEFVLEQLDSTTL